jgi:hypothetical protein
MFLDGGNLQVKNGYARPLACGDGATLADGKYHRVVWNLHRSSGTFEVYVDGRSVREDRSEGNRETSPLEEFLIGGAYGAGPLRRLTGALDDYRVYSRRLTRQEVAALR